MDSFIKKYYGFADLLTQFKTPPTNLIMQEVTGLYSSRVLSEQQEIISYYNIYEYGAEFNAKTGDNDSVLPDLRFKTVRQLINKEARFMTGKTPDFNVKVPYKTAEEKEVSVMYQDILQNVLNKILDDNHIGVQLNKAAKDCLIGKRVACMLNFNADSGVTLSFIPSLSFLYEQDEETGKLNKFICFYAMNDTISTTEQRIYKKKYWLQDGFCWVEETIYDGAGNVVEQLIPATQLLLDFVPAQVVLNDGLLGDTEGESEVKALLESESWESRLNCKDIAALEKSMNPTRYAIDASPESTQDLSIAAGSFWDLASSEDNDNQASVGVLESAMGYSSPLDNTIKRVRSNMFGLIDMPEINLETMAGSITTGKGMRAIYWGLITRVDEKMLAWVPFLRNIAQMIFKGVQAYPASLQRHELGELQIPFDVKYNIEVVNRYPIPEDEEAEKNMDIMEVNAQVKSKKAYIMKWEGLSEEEAEAELQQIVKEQQMLDSFNSSFGDLTGEDGTGESTEPPAEPAQTQEQ